MRVDLGLNRVHDQKGGAKTPAIPAGWVLFEGTLDLIDRARRHCQVNKSTSLSPVKDQTWLNNDPTTHRPGIARNTTLGPAPSSPSWLSVASGQQYGRPSAPEYLAPDP